MAINRRAQKAVDEFRNRLVSKDGDRIDTIVVYGSFLAGKFHPIDSDIDIGVLSTDKTIDEDILDIETLVSLKYGVVISALLMTQKELEKAKIAGYSFPSEVLKGKVLYERGKGRNKISL